MIVFVHGLGSGLQELNPLEEFLRPRFEICQPQRRPLGPGATYEDIFAEFLYQLEANDVPEAPPAYYLGYSFGGLLALTLARRFPERVRGVITIASPIFYRGKALERMQGKLREELATKGRSQERRERIETKGAGAFDELIVGLERMFTQMATDPPLTQEDLTAIQVPILFLSGEQDPFLPGPRARETAGLMPNARTGLFPGSGHPFRSVPIIQVKHAVTNFIDEVEAGRFNPAVSADLTAPLVVGGLNRDGISATLSPSDPKKGKNKAG